MISTEANEICEKENKKTINQEHIYQSLEVSILIFHLIFSFCFVLFYFILNINSNLFKKRLGFGSYVQEVRRVYDDYTTQNKVKERKGSSLANSGLTQEELRAKQDELCNQSRLKYVALEHEKQGN